MRANLNNVGRHYAMNFKALWILFIPLLGLFTIFRGGHFQWKVAPSSQLFSFIFWFGWVSALIVGLLVFLGYF